MIKPVFPQFSLLNRISAATLLCALLAACGGGSSGGGGSVDEAAQPPPQDAQASEVRLNAFTDFQCTSNWTNRDGALGLKAGTGSGTCQTTFAGVPGNYSVAVLAQTEFDGASIYRVSLNGQTIKSGTYPYSTGKLVCDCPDWRTNCPDKVVSLGAGVHFLNTGDVIEFYGEEVYPCGEHGAYAKWQGMVLTP